MKKKENVSEIFYFLIYLQGEQNDLGKRFPDPAYLLSSWRMQGQVLSFDNLIKSPGPNAALASPLRFMDGANEAWPRGGLVWNHSVLSHVVRPNQSQPGSPTCSLILFTRNGLDLQGYEENAFIRKSLEQKVKMDSLNPFGQGEEGVRISGVMNSGWHGAQPSNFQLV